MLMREKKCELVVCIVADLVFIKKKIENKKGVLPFSRR